MIIIITIRNWSFFLPLWIIFMKYFSSSRCLKYPKMRRMLDLPGSLGLTPSTPKNPVILRVQQFNVLADGLAALRNDLGKFSRVSKEILDFEVRKHQLLYEITQYDPDILTLQECDHYYDFFLPELEKQGYSGYFASKPTSACLEVSNNSDGCALFVKKDRLSIVSIETKTLALSVAELGDGGEVQEDDMNIKAQNQVAIIAICLLKNASEYVTDEKPVPGIVIATTHLKPSKTATGERHRALGIQQILDQVNNIYQSLEDRGKTPAVLLTGVFNAIPQTSSAGFPPLTYSAVKSNSLGLRSVYNDDIPLMYHKLNSSTFYTTWKARLESGGERVTKRAIDYIFYSTFRRGVYKNTINDRTQLNRAPITAISKTQIALSFLMRFCVYFFGALIPMSSILSSSMTNYEQLVILFISASLIVLFEVSSEGTVFKPQLAATIDTSTVKLSASAIDTSTNPACSVNSTTTSLSTSKAVTTAVNEVSVNVLENVGSLSQQILPLKQYGRPGFQAVSAVDVFSDEDIGQNLIPSERYPSDHISIVADLHLLW